LSFEREAKLSPEAVRFSTSLAVCEVLFQEFVGSLAGVQHLKAVPLKVAKVVCN
jgi:hypothetical protein